MSGGEFAAIEARVEGSPDMSEPNGCRWCGRILGQHGLYFTPPVGNHFFELPTDAQRLERMRERRVGTTGDSDA